MFDFEVVFYYELFVVGGSLEIVIVEQMVWIIVWCIDCYVRGLMLKMFFYQCVKNIDVLFVVCKVVEEVCDEKQVVVFRVCQNQIVNQFFDRMDELVLQLGVKDFDLKMD